MIEEFVLLSKMYEAVFQILRVGNSLELMMSSYQLLSDLDKVFFFAKNKIISIYFPTLTLSKF